MTTYLYTIFSGASVRVPIDLAAVRRDGWLAVGMELATAYDEPPLRSQMPTREQQRLEHMVGERMTSMDNLNAGLTRNGAARKEKSK